MNINKSEFLNLLTTGEGGPKDNAEQYGQGVNDYPVINVVIMEL